MTSVKPIAFASTPVKAQNVRFGLEENIPPANETVQETDSSEKPKKVGFLMKVKSYFSLTNLKSGWQDAKAAWKDVRQQKKTGREIFSIGLDLIWGLITHGITIALGLIWPWLFSSRVFNAFVNGVHQSALARAEQAKLNQTA